MSGRCLTTLTLAQFRSYTSASLALDARPVVLHGPNGAGKTNILEAISLFSPGRGLRGAAAAELGRAPGTLGWRLRGRFAGDDPVDVTLTGEPGGRRRVEIDGKAETQGALGRLVPVLWVTPVMDRLWLEGAEGRRRFLDRAALSFFPDHGTLALRYEKAMRERNRLLREGEDDPRWLDVLEQQMAEAGVAMAAARAETVTRLMRAQEAAETLFPRAEISIVCAMDNDVAQGRADGSPGDGHHAAIAEEFRAQLARGRRADAAAGRTLQGPHRSDLEAVMAAKNVPARQCSTGEQKALLLSLVMANARAVAAAGTPPVVLLDEVAAHLDEGRRAALFDTLCALDVQAFMTGTGPDLFEALGARAQHFRVAEYPGGSVVEAA